jgi:hypothetical protein
LSTLGKALLGLLLVALIASVAMLFGGSEPVGSENLIGRALPAFAAPLASGRLAGDANVYTPQQAEAASASPACEVRMAGAFNSCDGLNGRSIVVFFNGTKEQCTRHVDALERFHRRNPRVRTVVVAFDQSESEVRGVVARRGWTVPVAIDRDGAVASLYSVAGCPTTFFARDGVVTAVKLGTLTPAGFGRLLEAPTGVTGASG